MPFFQLRINSIPFLLLLFTTLGLTTAVSVPMMTVPVMAKPKPVSSNATSPLNNTVWQLVGGEMLSPEDKNEITLSFTAQGLSGSSGCNRYRSSFQTQGGQLKIKAIATTRMACPPDLMQRETAYLQALESAQSYRLNPQGELEIRYGDRGQSQMLRFAKIETKASSLQSTGATMPSLEGTTWTLLRLGTTKPLKERPTSLIFKDQKIAGTGGCNRFMGKFTTEGDRLIIDSQMASTMMACPGPLMKQEQQIVQALQSANRYQINGEGQLLIYTKEDETNPALTLIPADETNRVGTQKNVFVGPKTVPCSGVGRMDCLQVREKATDPWRLQYTPIKGFNYEPGYLYELQIREEAIANPPADGSSKQWVLLKVVKKSPWGQR